jgi:hypothetical protein
MRHANLLADMPSPVDVQDLGPVHQSLFVEAVRREINFPFAR